MTRLFAVVHGNTCRWNVRCLGWGAGEKVWKVSRIPSFAFNVEICLWRLSNSCMFNWPCFSGRFRGEFFMDTELRMWQEVCIMLMCSMVGVCLCLCVHALVLGKRQLPRTILCVWHPVICASSYSNTFPSHVNCSQGMWNTTPGIVLGSAPQCICSYARGQTTQDTDPGINRVLHDATRIVLVYNHGLSSFQIP